MRGGGTENIEVGTTLPLAASTAQDAGTEHDGWSLAARAEATLATIRARNAAVTAGRANLPVATDTLDDREVELDGICETLRQTDVFANLAERQLRRLARRCSEQLRPAGETIFRCGDRSDAVFVVREGSVDVLVDQRGKPLQRLARLNGGDIFGELGVLHGVERGASVRTAEDCRLLRIGKQIFLRLLEENVATEARLEALATRRHCRNSAAALDSRKNARIRIDAHVVLLPATARRRVTRLEDISQGGLSLTGMPAAWQPEEPVSFTLIAGDRRLCVIGRIAWRRGETAGIMFSGDLPGHGHRVSRFTRALLDELD